MTGMVPEDDKTLKRLHAELGVPTDYAQRCRLPLQRLTAPLVDAGVDVFDRPIRMTAATLRRWQFMCQAAAAEGVTLQVVSAYRDPDYQAGLIRRKLDTGESCASILTRIAAPGYSEHHTGRALDITTAGSRALEEDFEATDAFAWLCRHGDDYGFRLSFPRDNPYGVIYEPWHWFQFAEDG